MNVSNLISVWELEEASGTRSDARSSNHLTDNNTVTQTTGKVGNGAVFTAANSEFLSIASNSSLQVSGSFSIAFWVKLTGVGTTQFLVAKWGSSGLAGTREYYGAYVSGYGWNFAVRDSGDTTNYSVIHASGGASTGAWYFVSCVYDASGPTLSINVNNGTRTTIAGPAAAYTGTNSFQMGVLETGSVFFDGQLDQVVFFKRALSTTDESDLWNGGAGLSNAAMGGGGGGGGFKSAWARGSNQVLGI